MNLTVIICMANLPDDTELATVEDIIRRQVAEWLDFDQHPEDLHLSVEKTPCPSTA